VKVENTAVPGVLLLQPEVFEDQRGSLFESYNRHTFGQAVGIDALFVQDNRSISRRNVIRGLHYQIDSPQGKLIQVLRGEIFDVAVDLRRSSPTLGKWVAVRLSAANPRMAWIPPGFAHGLLALSDEAEVLYKMTELRSPEGERTIAWNDPQIGIAWPLKGDPVLSAKDAAGTPFRNADLLL
jgi:dTDP-4-dehydrorhamnose 3,5-epimerase